MGITTSSSKKAAGAAPSGRWAPIPDRFSTMAEVQDALRANGLESSNLIVGIDFTKSNEWTGKWSFRGRSLHHVGEERNPYQEATLAIASTLAPFDDDQLIPVYGFGDATTNDRSVFSFFPHDKPCKGLDHVMRRYSDIVPHTRLAGPTSFAPLIYRAINIVRESQGGFHILVIIADGQVTRSVDMPSHEQSVQEKETVQAIVDASEYPMCIVMVGVGDGPWDTMTEFDDALPARKFDNFQFVNFTSIAQKYGDQCKREAVFAVSALMEVPEQYKIIQRLGMLGRLPALHHGWKDVVKDPPGDNSGVWTTYGIDAPSAPPPHMASSGKSSADEGAMYLCPITQEVMRDPVIAADGYTYERSAIEAWLRKKQSSPMTNAPLEHLNLIPNHSLRSTIMESKH
mmetsp:Transcript_43782/g.78231  ORF Transcript_43782/g.78231 Transcript_43782/m.78231 type:complete len:400 (+) Transcript_43782:148-1347(+)